MGTGLLRDSGLSAEAERQLLERARNGDRVAVREIYARHLRKVSTGSTGPEGCPSGKFCEDIHFLGQLRF